MEQERACTTSRVRALSESPSEPPPARGPRRRPGRAGRIVDTGVRGPARRRRYCSGWGRAVDVVVVAVHARAGMRRNNVRSAARSKLARTN